MERENWGTGPETRMSEGGRAVTAQRWSNWKRDPTLAAMLAAEGIYIALSYRWWEAIAQNILRRMAMASDDRAEPKLIQETTAALLEATATSWLPHQGAHSSKLRETAHNSLILTCQTMGEEANACSP
jgi:hypothetical protein